MSRGNGYDYDGVRRALVLADPRLTRQLQREPERCASVSEYAAATGIETWTILDLFGPAIDDGVLGMETVGSELFIHTAPRGRPTPPGVPDVAANLWERLRDHGDTHTAYQMWQLVRSLEHAGWTIEANQSTVRASLAAMHDPPQLGLHVSNQVYPLVIFPEVEAVQSPTGRLYELAAAGAGLCAIVCDSGALDEMITATRRFYADVGGEVPMSVIVLEGPSYNPTIVTQKDASVAGRSLSKASRETDVL